MKNGINLENRKKRIALKIQYDGTAYRGFQIQAGEKTVQGEIEKALHVLYKEKIRITPAGRTDAGVHALGQVIHFDAGNDLQLKKICSSMNGILPADISVNNAYKAPETFHARFSARSREYVYLIYNHPQRNPLLRNKALWIRDELDIDLLKTLAGYFVGEKDFASFCKSKSDDENTIRKIDAFEITRKNDIIIFRITGNAFLRNMIRIITGTMLDIIKTKSSPDLIPDIFTKKDRQAGGKTASAYGLYLNTIIYDPPLSEMESAF